MKVVSRAVVRAGGRLPVLESAAPLTLRRVRSDDRDTCALRVVGSAAGPLAGDELTLRLDVGPHARCDLQATGASIAQGRDGAPATVRMDIGVGEDAALAADPGPLVVCDGSRVDVSLRLELAASAWVRWDETIVLGRTHDAGTGAATVRWDVTRAGRPVLRQLIDLADPVLRSWRGHTDRRRALASAFVSGPDVRACTSVAPDLEGVRYAVAQRIDDTTALVTVLADDVHLATKARDALVGTLETCPRVSGWR